LNGRVGVIGVTGFIRLALGTSGVTGVTRGGVTGVTTLTCANELLSGDSRKRERTRSNRVFFIAHLLGVADGGAESR